MSAPIEELRSMGYAVDIEPRISGIIMRDFEIHVGRHSGKKVDVALGVDLPATPPAGIHIRPAIAAGVGVNPSPLGNGWQYVSRRHGAWNKDRNVRSVVAYIHRVLSDV